MNSIHPVYVLDTNVFVEASRHYYAFDIVPRFWQSLIKQAENGRIQSIDRVKDELDKGGEDKDELKIWAKNDFHTWFASTDEDTVLDAYRKIIEWANGQQQYMGAAKEEISRGDNADAWVVAYALSMNYVVVTQEGDQPQARKKRIPIPNVCKAFDIHWIDIYQMLRNLRIKIC